MSAANAHIFVPDLTDGAKHATQLIGDLHHPVVVVANPSGDVTDPATETTLAAILAALGGASGLRFYLFGESLAVATATPTTVVSYTVPVGKKLIMAIVHGSATSRAEFNVRIDASTLSKKNTQVTQLNTEFMFGAGPLVGVEISAGSTADVVITHNQPGTADMNATIFGELEDA